MRSYWVFITNGDIASSYVVHAENEYMAARAANLFDDEIIYRVDERD